MRIEVRKWESDRADYLPIIMDKVNERYKRTKCKDRERKPDVFANLFRRYMADEIAAELNGSHHESADGTHVFTFKIDPELLANVVESDWTIA